mgnify:CR=1 FL=1
MKNILLAIDFDVDHSHMLSYAIEQSKAFSAKVWVLHIAAPDPDFVGNDAGPKYVREELADELRQEHKEIQEMAEEMRSNGAEAEALLIQGPTVETLMNEVERLDADMMILGFHQHSLLQELITGSTTYDILKKTKVPVLVIPPKK